MRIRTLSESEKDPIIYPTFIIYDGEYLFVYRAYKARNVKEDIIVGVNSQGSCEIEWEGEEQLLKAQKVKFLSPGTKLEIII